MLLELQQQQPALYAKVTEILNPDEQQVIQSVINEADVKAAEAAAAVGAVPVA